MDAFFKVYNTWSGSYGKPSDFFGYKDVKELNFRFIEHQDRHKMSVLVDDLESIALKFRLDKHKLDKDIKQKMDTLWQQSEDRYAQIMKSYQETDEHLEKRYRDRTNHDELNRYLQNREKMQNIEY